MLLVVVAVATVITAAFVASSGEPSIEHQPTPTPQELEKKRRAEFDARPEHDKLRISEDVGVIYVPCVPDSGDQIDEIEIMHFPSGSWFTIPPTGLGPQRTDYLSSEGEAALEAIRSDRDLMRTIIEREPDSARCPERESMIPEDE